MATLSRVWWAWAMVYFVTGASAMSNGGTGIFAHPVDEFDSFTFSLVFLNFPLQMLLAASAHVLWHRGRAPARKLATAVGVAATALIAVNAGLGIWFAVT